MTPPLLCAIGAAALGLASTKYALDGGLTFLVAALSGLLLIAGGFLLSLHRNQVPARRDG